MPQTFRDEEREISRLGFTPVKTAIVREEANKAVQACSAAAQSLSAPLSKVLAPNDELMKAITLASNSANITKAQIIPG